MTGSVEVPPVAETALVARLRAAGCVFAEEEAALLVEAATDAGELEQLVRRRLDGEPLEPLLGWAEFRGRRMAVGPGVFVPRRRSEFLAQLAVAACRGVEGRPAVLVELCCGVAAIAAAVAAELQDAGVAVRVHAADVDPVAAGYARRNLAEFDGFVGVGDLDAPLPRELLGRVDCLVANAPYVPTDEVAHMPREARDAEPLVALDGGPDGLALHRRIAAAAPRWLTPGGVAVIETSERQAEASVALLVAAGLDAHAERSETHGAVAAVGRMPAA
ncbi:methylase [Agromyces rhizosphaerae]|uniref:Methylase n=1 Tax=Agromyces rhizosphaerae TaxID=88374 RepID=A0A9W6CQY7_9MICO|nr:putative protein N(5)-glutamine methyltransferase [Agromyces rhizosphaerae]GLI26893.1 methylase [Agromyces rhizosphaerae]